ncbi:MAG TPA: hypothetical protein VG347_12350 [Verrucomicrobiae bacterium]|nr:hypothetical protein [Verrucomicrobiae bacterium]
MRIRSSTQTNQGLTLIEAIVVLCVIALFAMVIVPTYLTPHHYRSRIGCTNNLKQTALAFKIWAGDNNDRFPMQVSVTNGGAMEATAAGDALKAFQQMSNELSTPKVIICPNDFLRHFAATNFTTDLTNKVSYFIGADATDANPQMILAGDNDLLFNQSPVHPGIISVTVSSQLEWNADRHGGMADQGWFKKPKKIAAGNIALTDGSVQSCYNIGLSNYLSQTGLTTNRLLIP